MHKIPTAIAAVTLLSTFAAHATEYRLVALSGDSAIGFDEPVGSVRAPIINASGDVAFSGNTRSSFASAVWQSRENTLRYVIVAEQPLDGLDSNPSSAGVIAMDDNGDMAISVADQNSARAVYVEVDEALLKVVYEADSPPQGGTWNLYAQDFTWRGGQVAFFGAVNTLEGARRQLWLGPPSNPQVFGQEGGPSPIEGQVYTSGFDTPLLNRFGEITFVFSTDTSGGVGGGPVDDIALFATEGQVGPETANTLSTITPKAYTDDGIACLTANHRDMSGAPAGSAFYLTTDEGLEIVTPNNWNPPGFNEQFVLVDSVCANGRQVALIALSIDRSFSERVKGVWAGRPGALELAALEGEQAPGLADGVVFDDIEDFVIMNSQGVVAFLATVTGPGINANNERGLWAGLPGQLELIAQTGTIIETGRGSTRVFELRLSSGGLNDTNELAFATGGSVFVATLDSEALSLVFSNGFE